ncbi:SpvB/TcaC N-terminal domain-containing protein [Shewanella woodyi]|uniref:SpvB/TcaC N-terminal domain-containing protein n=1 Tax=Shewanella woodyi TaxID=60961 RepID=UPI003748AA62
MNPVNDVPTISGIGTQSLNEDSSNTIGFSISDVETATTSLSVSRRSSNSTLLPTSRITLGGSGANRTVRLTPVANKYGSAVVYIDVSDGTSTTTRAFTVNVASVNDVPTISGIGTQSLNEDSSKTIGFSISDVETATTSLSVSRRSSNSTLLPTSRITLGGSGANRTVRLTPVANKYGTAVVYIDVSDGTSTTTRAFTVNVASVNDVPTISGIGTQSLNEDSSKTIGFSISDVETATTSLSVSRRSSNSTLLPTSRITLGGSGANRTVRLTPVANKYGTAVVYIDVSDGTSTTTRAFTVNVASVNDVPTISGIGTQSLNEDSSKTIGFSISDVETATTSLSVSRRSSNSTLLPTSRITLGGSGANRTVRLTPVANKYGTAVVYIDVSDGTSTTTRAFTVNVASVNDVPTISGIGTQSLNEDSSKAIGFSISDVETATTSLSVSRRSSNSTLLPTSRITLGGSGANRTVRLTPVANKYGAAVVYIDVSDGTSTTTRAFTVNVASVNDVPTISGIGTQSLNEDSSKTIGFSISDVETATTSLSVSRRSSNSTLLPTSRITLGGSGANRTVRLTPVANKYGTAVVYIDVSDGTTTTTQAFTVNVVSIDDMPLITLSAVSDLKGIQPLIVSASATDIDSDISSIQFSLNGESWVSTSNSPYSYNFGELQEGTHSVRAKVNTSTNQSAETPSKTFRVLPAVLVDINTIADSTNSLVTAATNELVGEINGQASVDGGAFAYSVPISIAPGRKGMQPNISLNYSSQSGSGLAGLGWNLSAYSSISRCGQVYDLDEASVSAHYSADDKLCYNGSRLVAVNAPNGSSKGAYGTSGTYYKTERNGSVLIQQLGGGINSNNSYFVITDTNGTKHYLGKTSNSQIVAANRSEPSSWLQHQTEDRFGNQVDYLYDESVQGNRYIQEIFYTGFNGTAGNRKVHFNYVEETESRHYHWGGYSLSNKRLDSISVQIDDVEKALWQLGYSLTTDIEDKERAKLTTLSYCDGGDATQCLTTNFNWLNKSYGHQKASSHSLDAIDDNYAVGLRVRKDHDYDGDGVLDLYIPLKGVYLSGSGALLDRTELPSISPTQPAGDLDYDGIVSINEKSSNVVNGSLDYDGDGRADFTYLNEHGELLITGINNDASIKFTYNTGIDATCYASVLYEIGDKFCESHAIDFNGDGRSDLLVATNKQAGTGNFQITYKSYLKNTGSGYSYNGEFTASAGEPLTPMDLDGDGILDLVPSSFSTTLKWYKVGVNNTTGQMTFVEKNETFNVTISTLHRDNPSRWVDLNGDGLSDILTLHRVNSTDNFYTRYVIFNQGGGQFSSPVTTGMSELAWQVDGGHIANDETPGYVYEQYAQFIDYNGDGRQDILYPDRSRRKYFYNCFDWSSNEECRAVDGADAPRFHDYDIWYWNVLITRPDGISFDKIELNVYGALATMNTIDITGDGRLDFVSGLGFESDATRRTWTYPTNGPREFAVFSHVDTQDNVINQVSTAMGTKVQIDYKQLKEVYHLDRVDNQYPYINFANTMRVVSGFETDNGIGGLNHTEYQYENARFHIAGRGFQGFGAITETNNSAEAKHQITTRTEFYQDFPWSGMVRQKQSHDYQGNQLSHYLVTNNAPSMDDYQVGDSQCFYPAQSVKQAYVPERQTSVTSVTNSQSKNARCQVITNETVTSDSQVTHTKTLEQSFTQQGDSLLSLPHVTTNVANVQYHTGAGANLDVDSLKVHNSVTLSYQSNQHGVLALTTSETKGLGSSPGIGATTTYSEYDEYGHPLKVQTGDRWNASTMTSDGYFIKETTNSQWGANIASSNTFDPLTGTVLTTTDVNGITTTNVINFIGQVSQTAITKGDTTISPPVHVSHQWASAPYAFKTITRSSGTPEQISYFDSKKE